MAGGRIGSSKDLAFQVICTGVATRTGGTPVIRLSNQPDHTRKKAPPQPEGSSAVRVVGGGWWRRGFEPSHSSGNLGLVTPVGRGVIGFIHAEVVLLDVPADVVVGILVTFAV